MESSELPTFNHTLTGSLRSGQNTVQKLFLNIAQLSPFEPLGHRQHPDLCCRLAAPPIPRSGFSSFFSFHTDAQHSDPCTSTGLWPIVTRPWHPQLRHEQILRPPSRHAHSICRVLLQNSRPFLRPCKTRNSLLISTRSSFINFPIVSDVPRRADCTWNPVHPQRCQGFRQHCMGPKCSSATGGV